MVEETTLILIVVFSGLLNVMVILLSFFTGTGKEVLKRWRQRRIYKKGKHVNAVFLTKSGVAREAFIKKSKDGDFKYQDNTYVTNPSLLFHYKGLPTNIYREGTPDPINAFMDSVAGDMSCAEMDSVMHARDSFDIRLWLEQQKMMFLIALVVMVGAAVIGAYFGFQTFQMLRDGTYASVSGAVTGVMGITS